jgi:hypothetical protein
MTNKRTGNGNSDGNNRNGEYRFWFLQVNPGAKNAVRAWRECPP